MTNARKDQQICARETVCAFASERGDPSDPRIEHGALQPPRAADIAGHSRSLVEMNSAIRCTSPALTTPAEHTNANQPRFQVARRLHFSRLVVGVRRICFSEDTQ